MNPFTRPGARRPSRLQRRWVRHVAAATGLALLPGFLTPTAFALAAAEPLGKPSLDAPRSAKVSPFTARVNKRDAALVRRGEASDQAAARRARADQATKVRWPIADTASVSIPTTGTARTSPGSLPLTLEPPKASGQHKVVAARSVDFRVLDHKSAETLGVKGVVLSATGPQAGGRAKLGLDYSAFASAYGGDWAGRLELESLPACALTDPTKAACRKRTPLRFTNDRHRNTLTTELAFPDVSTSKGISRAAGTSPMVLAVAAGTKSGAGDYKATPLSASSTWEAGGSSGNFTWSYPLRVPPAAAGPSPDLSISYDSSSVDGETATTNNQGSQIGEGFDLTSSYVERKYGSCDDDGQDEKYDLCWKYDNASLVLNGKSTELVKDDTSGEWHLKDDDASTVTHSIGADNGDDNGEYWTVTTGDGTRYVFGLNKLDGAGADDRTHSVWTVPVFGDDSGEPGYDKGSKFADRDLKQAWRWNLDYVQDTHGNASTYWYAAEDNNYDKLGDDTTGTSYTRGGYLKEIRYGQRKDSLFTGSPAASDKVTFGYAERCLASGSGCDSLTEDTEDNWPDVPFDAVCKDGDKCTGNVSPAFFTRKRLTSISTWAWDAGASPAAFAPVDTWTLKQLYLDPGETGDSHDQTLWLDQIAHTGKHGADLNVPPVSFSHEFHANRVDGATDDILSLDRPRLKTVTSESGAQTIVTYAEPDCVAGQTMPKVDANTKTCYPVYWSPNGAKDPILDWFQKYPVRAVSVTDPQGGAEAVQHTYTYSGGGAWHYNDDPLTPAKERTWSIWRGFERVTHVTGASDATQLKEVSVYLRGMDGDRLLGSDGRTPDPDKRRSADVTGVKAPEVTDSDQYAGFLREGVTYNGATEVSGTINDPWSKRTATQHKSYADTESYFVRTGASHARTNITSSVTPYDRVRTTKTTYDDHGMAETVEDDGDDARTGDETCTRNTYARNDDAGITNLISRTRVVARPCSVPDYALDLPHDDTRQGDVISDTATSYDSTTYQPVQHPTLGEPRWTGRVKSYGSDATPNWQKVTATGYDSLGRPTTVKDTNDLTTTATSYTPATRGPLTATAVTNAKGHESDSTVDFATGSVTKATDPNGKVTETEYDSLGRATKVWLPNRLKVLNATPNYVYAYHLSNDPKAMTWVSTGTLNGDGSAYNTTYQFYDSQLRPRQTQSPSPAGGRVIAQSLYDSRGLEVTQESDIWDSTTAPGDTPVEVDGGQAPTQTDTTFDGASRPTRQTTKVHGVTRWTTDTAYTGDRTANSAPAGGQASATLSDARGQKVEQDQYAGPKPQGTDYTATKYTYTPGGKPATVTGPDQAEWTYDYDLYGRQTATTDPDKGRTESTYNSLDQVTSTTDAEDRKLLFSYDDLGRKTGMWQGQQTDANKLAAWTFDSLAKGQPDTSTRYDGGLGGKAYTQKVTKYDNLYQATNNELALPADDPLVIAGVPSRLSFSTGYRVDGSVGQHAEPAVAGLPAETLTYKYTATGQLTKLTGKSGYLLAGVYSPLGDLRQMTLGTDSTSSAKKAYLNWDYEEGTRRLTRSFVTDDTHGYMPQELKFTQDDAGNVTSVFDATTQGSTTKADYQCFTYDGHQRLTESWTPKTADCSTSGRTNDNIDGAAPYWTSYTYTSSGQRKTETQHTTSDDSSTTYHYESTPTKQPHPLTSTSTGETTEHYTYDKTGNTTTRPGTQATQTLSWNSESNLATTSEPATDSKPALETGYLYDADGNLLIRRAKDDGETVLYLGATEVHLNTKGATKNLTSTRNYTAGSQTIAVRTATAGISSSKLTFLAADPHGTASLAMDSVTWAVTKRYTTPFGADRGTPATSWPDDKKFLGKPADLSTGLTHIGAREYDPSIGQFISVDPALQVEAPQTLNGYSYATQNPVTESDPTGQYISCGVGCEDQDVGRGPNGDQNIRHPGAKKSGTSSSSSTGKVSSGKNKSEGSGFWGLDFSWVSDGAEQILQSANSLVWGAISVVPHTAEGAGWLFDSDCWHGGPGAPGCDYGDQFDHWLSHQGIETDTPLFRAAGDLAELLGSKEGPEGGVEFRAGRYGMKASSLCSFSFDTFVLMSHGEKKRIGDIKVGDFVEAANPKNGKHEGARKVLATFINHDSDLIDLEIRQADGAKSILHTTAKHPFWDDTLHAWVKAGRLSPGHLLVTAANRHVTVGKVLVRPGEGDMHNMTVAQLHTYYVLAGATPVLVHNSGPNCGVPLGGKNGDHLGGEDFHGSEYSLDEITEFVNGHTGDGNPAMGRPSAAEVETTLRQAGSRQLEGQNSSRFDHDGVRVIVNWDMPWKSTAYYPGR
ncbi:polymorphic toxin-type HINT domain-containing protein [Streptomyces sp. NPDC059740]|uniref:polymorphic toxin-type HINT domain-containing protein n=1 Tax=Streptomyces sp. NPDC059740 TaxID=3346926 RepID=UPI003669451B